MTSPRNLVLLLSSGHTVRIALRDDDLTGNAGWDEIRVLMASMPAVVGFDEENVTFAYIEDPTLPRMVEGAGTFEAPNDFQRISVEGPGTVVQYG